MATSMPRPAPRRSPVRRGFGTASSITRQALSEWWGDKASRLSGALAFFTIFSLAPMLLIVIAVGGSVLGEQAARGEIISQLSTLIGTEGARFVESVLVSARKQGTLAASVVGLSTTFIGATAVFAELQDGLNTVWGVVPKESGFLHVVKHRLISFAMVVAIGFVLMVSLALSAALAATAGYAREWVRVSPVLVQAANFVLSLGVIALLFALIYKVLPDAEIGWRDVWAGAAISAVLFSTGKFFIGLYLGNSSVGSTYGAAGSLAVLLVWIYYSAQVLYLGAEFTQAFADQVGSGIRPKAHAALAGKHAP